MKTIIAPTDFSPASLNAVQYAFDMALAFNSNLLILHATGKSFDQRLSSSPEEDEETGERKLLGLQKILIKKTGDKIKVRIKQVSGVIEDELIKICDKNAPFAVVMATHGSSLRKLFLIGSITVYMAKSLKYPVMVVPVGVQFKPIKNITLATDLKNVDSLPIEKISLIITSFKASLDIIHVSTGGKSSKAISVQANELRNYLDHLKPQFYFVHNKNIHEGIISFAGKQKADMILAFPKKHSFFHSSESQQLIFNSPVTVMTIQ